jgi:hypothetical protein
VTLRHLIPSDPDALDGGGLCSQIDPDAWFDPAHSRYAKRICNSGCPIKDQCLADALRDEEGERWSHGVRGGLLAHERRRLIRDARRTEQQTA